MTSDFKSRSPNYPSRPLDWAVNSALSILDQQGGHVLPPDVVASSLNYKDAGSGPAKSAIAALKSYGILEKDGSKLRLSKAVQQYKLTPTQEGREAILQRWLLSPALYSELIEKYGVPLPTDEVLIHDLVIENAFTEKAAKRIVSNLKSSLEFANFGNHELAVIDDEDGDITDIIEGNLTVLNSLPGNVTTLSESGDVVRYPVRLAGGRMAYIEVPAHFYNKDKKKLQAQLEIIGTLDEDDDDDDFLSY